MPSIHRDNVIKQLEYQVVLLEDLNGKVSDTKAQLDKWNNIKQCELQDNECCMAQSTNEFMYQWTKRVYDKACADRDILIEQIAKANQWLRDYNND